jgi:hypothetical protein
MGTESHSVVLHEFVCDRQYINAECCDDDLECDSMNRWFSKVLHDLYVVCACAYMHYGSTSLFATFYAVVWASFVHLRLRRIINYRRFDARYRFQCVGDSQNVLK